MLSLSVAVRGLLSDFCVPTICFFRCLPHMHASFSFTSAAEILLKQNKLKLMCELALTSLGDSCAYQRHS